jgi:hypothetical protein
VTKIWAFLTGKKTYLAAIALAALGLAGFWFGELDLVQAEVLLSLALAIAGIGHKLDRQMQLVLHELDVKKRTGKFDVPAIEKEVLQDAVEQSVGRMVSSQPSASLANGSSTTPDGGPSTK